MTASAFAEGSLRSQAVFREVMNALARPGDIRRIEGVAAPAALSPGAAAVIETLADYETPVWLDPALAKDAAVCDWIRFRTGAPITTDSDAAAFAVVGDPRALPDFSEFSPGTPDYPDRSTTIILQIEDFTGVPLTLAGPGINGTRAFAARPLPDGFAARLAANRELFPRGVDLVLVAGERLAALPRSIHLAGD